MSEETNKVRLNNMMLITSQQQDGTPTFRAIPLTSDCPFIELIFDTKLKRLVAINKEKHSNMFFVPRLNENGMPIQNKDPKSKIQVPHQQERKTTDTYYEHFISNIDEVRPFLELFVVNPKFNVEAFF